MQVEKWIDFPPGIDEIVQKKESLDPKEWLLFLRNFYRKVLEDESQSKKEKFSDTKNVNYHAILLDLVSGLERMPILNNSKKNKEEYSNNDK